MSYLVKHYMNKNVPKIEVAETATKAAKAMIKAGRGFLIVLSGGEPTGIITENDIVKKIIAGEKDPAKTIVGDIMSSPLISVDPDDDLLKASELMHKHDVRRLLVMKDGIIYGYITSRDIAQRCGEYVDRSVKDIMRWATPFG